jgi:ribosome maturation factor RimP
MDLSERIQGLIEPSVDDLGYDIVRVLIMGKDQVVVQIMAEHKDGQGMTADNCATISRVVSALLEVDDPIQGAYTLEVSSPGLDRPLVRLRDFERFQGLEAKIEINRPLDGRRRFRGQLLGVDGDTVKILVDGVEVDLSHPDIHKAKLLMTDELIAASEDN